MSEDKQVLEVLEQILATQRQALANQEQAIAQQRQALAAQASHLRLYRYAVIGAALLVAVLVAAFFFIASPYLFA